MSVDDGLPVLPYAGTSGWSGSDTSRRRALEADLSGVTGHRQAQVLRCLHERGAYGVTDYELQQVIGEHHGITSSALTGLHKAGRIARLAIERNSNEIYVALAFVGDRPTARYRPVRGSPRGTLTEDECAALERARGALMVADPDLTVLVAALDRLAGQ